MFYSHRYPLLCPHPYITPNWVIAFGSGDRLRSINIYTPRGFSMKHKISSTAKAPLARDSSVPKTELANHSITYHRAKEMSRSIHQH